MQPPDPDTLLRRLEPAGIELGLERPRALAVALGRPEERFGAVLVAGTNGKGSVAAMLASMLAAAGYRAGLYTSPALESATEQVRIAGRRLATAELARRLAAVEAAAGRALGGPPTPFEALTAAAFGAFADARVDLAVIEVGMGGARDATNLARPVLSVLTSVGLEHRRFLGDTLEEIAREKAGIFRPDTPALAGELPAAARGEVAAAAGRLGARLEPLVPGTRWRVDAASTSEQRVTVTTPSARHELTLPTAGAHQAANLALAVRAAELLQDAGFSRLAAGAIAAGAARVELPGRLEPVTLPDGRRLLLDAAHNPHAVAALARHLDTLASPRKPVSLLFGVLGDKEAEHMLPPLARRARLVTLTRPPGPRGREPLELLPLIPPALPVTVEPDLDRALDVWLEGLSAGGFGLATGSLALVGEVRRRLRHRFGIPAAG